MAKHDTAGLKTLRAQIKEKNIGNVYLIYGDEDFLKHYYTETIKKIIIDDDMEEFNYTVFEGEKQDLDEIRLTLQTPPMMSQRKMVLIKDSKIFKTATEAQKTFWTDTLAKKYEDTCIVFLEDEADKRGVIYKAVAKAGLCAECAYLQGTELINWVARGCRAAGKTIGKEEIEYLIGCCDASMNSIKREIEKLFAYCDNDRITISDIDKIVTKMPQSRVFEMINDMLSKNARAMFEKLEELKSLKDESVFGILALLNMNFEKILRVKLLLEKGMSYKAAASELKIFSSQMYIYSSAAKTFSKSFLRAALCKTAQIDYDIKSGKIKDWLAVEQFLAWCIEGV